MFVHVCVHACVYVCVHVCVCVISVVNGLSKKRSSLLFIYIYIY